jgi:hypothetical protein
MAFPDSSNQGAISAPFAHPFAPPVGALKPHRQAVSRQEGVITHLLGCADGLVCLLGGGASGSFGQAL